MAFVSSDRLHERCAHLFLRGDQQFVWGQDLKADLKGINDHFLQLPEDVRGKGVIGWSHHPPAEFLVSKIWDKHMRSNYREADDVPMDAEKKRELFERLKAFRESPTLTEDVRRQPQDEMITIERQVRRKRGSWWQVPKDLPDPK